MQGSREAKKKPTLKKLTCERCQWIWQPQHLRGRLLSRCFKSRQFEVVSCICFENSKSGLVERALFRKLGPNPSKKNHQCTKRAGYISGFYVQIHESQRFQKSKAVFSFFGFMIRTFQVKISAKQMCWIHWNTEKKGSFLGIPAFRKILPPLLSPNDFENQKKTGVFFGATKDFFTFLRAPPARTLSSAVKMRFTLWMTSPSNPQLTNKTGASFKDKIASLVSTWKDLRMQTKSLRKRNKKSCRSCRSVVDSQELNGWLSKLHAVTHIVPGIIC